jgi:uncharacterized protein GlcG (DUF336 family)
MKERAPHRPADLTDRRYPRAAARRLLAGLTALVAVSLSAGQPLRAQSPGGAAETLTSADVMALVTAAAGALNDDTLAVGVVDRAGTILGVYGRPRTPAMAPDMAVSLARTTAYFSNDQAPLSSRTVRFISGIHFPAGVSNTPPAALYGVENLNRGCNLGPFNAGVAIDRPRSIAGTIGTGAGTLPLPCNPMDTRGCAVGGPITGLDGSAITSLGITTGKPNLLDSPSRFGATGGGLEDVNPGGIPLYRNGKLIGGVGVAGVAADRAQYAALIAAAGTGRGITTALVFPSRLPTPGAIFIDGIRLPFYGSCGTNLSCIQAEADGRPSGSAPGNFPQGTMLVTARDGRQAPEGYLIGPRASQRAGGLTRDDVIQIVDQAIATSDNTRAQVRLPYGQTARVIIAVTDQAGAVLAEYRMADALFDAVDVVPSKARNAYYFSTREGYEVLLGYVERSTDDSYAWEPAPPNGQGWALTSRTIGFGGQPLFPPGIDLEKPATRGPWFDLFVFDTLNPCTEGSGPSRGGNRQFPNQNGITWFPGSAPLYKDGQLVGGLGVSGDGIDQNDLITAGGATGFEPPDAVRVDNSVIRVGNGQEVRLPYLKFPRNPTQR